MTQLEKDFIAAWKDRVLIGKKVQHEMDVAGEQLILTYANQCASWPEYTIAVAKENAIAAELSKTIILITQK